MTDAECIHGDAPATCGICIDQGRRAQGTHRDLTGQEKLLVFCPAITDDTLLHFSRRGGSYRLRAYVGRRAGKREWVQPDAPTSDDFFRLYAPQHQIDVAPEQLSVDRDDQWADLVERWNRQLGIGA